MTELVNANAGWHPPHPTVEGPVDELLHGAYDLHVHAGPDRRARRFDALDLAQAYHDAGLVGAVVKDHFLPTIGRTHVINRVLPDFRCFSTCTLNSSVGGVNPATVETALDVGVDWFIMPTVSATGFRRYEGHTVDPAGSWRDLSIQGPDGELLPEVHAVLDLLAGRDVVLASGHLSPTETLHLFRAAKRRGVERLVVTHASIDFLRMPLDIQKEIAGLGGIIEHAYVSCLFRNPVTLDEIWSQIRELGPESCYLASDLGQPHNPSPLTGWRAAIGGLLALGASESDIRRLVADIPAALVESLPRFSGTWIPDGWDPQR